jgi:predicted kinase
MKQSILIVNGPICGGKTKAVDVIMNNYKRVFRLSPNKIKFLISDYTPDRDRASVHECTMIIAERMFANGMSLILEGGSVAQGNLNEQLAELATKNGIALTIVNVEAPIEILKKRFEDRIDTALMRGSKISVTDDEGFMQRYNAYLAIRPTAQHTFDSSRMSPVEIGKAIMDLVS